MEPVNSAYNDFQNFSAIEDGGPVVSKNGRVQIIRDNNCHTKALSDGEDTALFETGISNNADSDSNIPAATKIGNKRCFVVESAPSLLDNAPRKIHKFEQRNESSLTEVQEVKGVLSLND